MPRYIEIFKSAPQEFRSISYNPSTAHTRAQGPPDPWFPPYRPMEGPRMRYNPRVAPYDRYLESPRGPNGMSRVPPPFRRTMGFPEWDDYCFRGKRQCFIEL